MPRKKTKPDSKPEKDAQDEVQLGGAVLSDKQLAFALEYVKDWNATQAAIRAGYNVAGARVQGHHLLTNPNIRTFINQALAEMGVTAERVLAEHAALAYSDMGDMVDIQDGGAIVYKPSSELQGKTKLIKKIKEKRRILSSGKGDGDEVVMESTIELELYDKQKSLDSLARVLNLVKETSEKQPESNDKPADLTYTQWHGLSEDDKTIYLATGELPQTGLGADSK